MEWRSSRVVWFAVLCGVALAGCEEPGGGGGVTCSGSTLTCSAPTSANECRAGQLRLVSCGGPAGCNAGLCDESLGVAGQPCSQFAAGRTTCAFGGGRKVQCTNGSWVDLGACDGCQSTGADVVCAMPVPDAGSPLQVSPTTTSSPPRGLVSLAASGGTPPYSWSMQSSGSGGTVNATAGEYRAGTIGGTSDVVKVADSAGASAFVSIAVGPGVTLSPAMPSTTTGGTLTFTATGGAGTGWQYSIATNATGGSINTSSGAYVAGSTAGTDLVQVVDALGNVASTPVAVAARIPRWTFLVYANADNNLEPAALDDLLEMANPGSSPDVNVLVEIDRHPGYTSAGVLNQPNFTGTKRFRVENGSLTQLADLGETDMGATTPLANFVDWGIRYAPAQKIALIFWDHGAGWTGFGQDETNGNNSLLLGEIRQGVTLGLASAGRAKLDLLGFDACLMATWETAYELRNLADVFVASEDVEPGHGWDYSPVVTAMRNNTTLSAADLGRVIADGFKAQAATNPAQAPIITLSVIDLAKMGALVNAVNGLATALRAQVMNIQGWLKTATARAESHEFPAKKGYNLIDLGHFAQRAKANMGSALSSEADALTAALANAVLYKVGGAAQANANGASTYFALQQSAFDPAYQTLEVLSATSWDEFLADYLTLQNTDTQPPVLGPVTHGTAGFTASVTGTDIDPASAQLIVLQGSAGSRRVIGTFPAVYANNQVTQSWGGEVFTLSTGAATLTVPLFYGGRFQQNGTPAQIYLVSATYKDPTATQFIPIVLRYVFDGTTLAFGGAYSTGGAVAEVTLLSGGVLRAIQMVEQQGSLTQVEDTSNPLTLGSAALTLGIELGVVGNYDVGFAISDFAGNQATAVASFNLTCAEDSQCRSSAGKTCNVSTGACVQCTATNSGACVGATPVCDAATNSCVQCTTANVSACSGSQPYCVANTCAQCLYGFECSNATDVCVAGQCTSIIGRTIAVNVYAATIPGTTSVGDAWDAFNGSPDPFVEIYANGVSLGRTATKQDTLSPVWNTTAQFTFSSASTLQFDAWDEDLTTNDYIESIGWSSASGVLSLVRAGGYFGTPTNGRVSWTITAEAR